MTTLEQSSFYIFYTSNYTLWRHLLRIRRKLLALCMTCSKKKNSYDYINALCRWLEILKSLALLVSPLCSVYFFKASLQLPLRKWRGKVMIRWILLEIKWYMHIFTFKMVVIWKCCILCDCMTIGSTFLSCLSSGLEVATFTVVSCVNYSIILLRICCICRHTLCTKK